MAVLTWAHENGCPWDSCTCMKAACHGQLLTLIWLRRNGCPWDESTCAFAADHGHLEVLK